MNDRHNYHEPSSISQAEESRMYECQAGIPPHCSKLYIYTHTHDVGEIVEAD